MVEKQKAPEMKPKEIEGVYKDLKVGDEVTVVSKLPNFPGDKIGSKDVFSGTVVKRDDKIGAVYIEAPLTAEWRNLWKARFHKVGQIHLSTHPLLIAATKSIDALDPLGWQDQYNKNLAKYLGGWFSRVEIRDTKKGPVLRYVLYKNDIDSGYVKELNVEKKFTREEMMEALGGKTSTSPYGPIKPPKEKAPEVSPKKEEKPKIKKPETGVTPTPTKRGPVPPSPYGGRAVSKTEIEKLEEKSNEELLDMISLDYGTPGIYKGYNWIGGARGLRAGIDVAALQILLNRILGTNIKEDGVYGDETAAAIRKLQEKLGVTPDGYFGIDTKTALGAYLATLEKVKKPTKEEEEKVPEEVEKPPESKEVVRQVLILTREIDRDYVKPPKGVTQLMDENFYVHTDAGWMSAKELVWRNLSEVDRNWNTDKETAQKIAGRENWNTRTLTRKNVGVFSWANTKKVLFPYLMASGQEFEFRTWEPLSTEDGTTIPAGKVIRGRITEYDEATGEFKVEVLAVQDEFTAKGETAGAPAGGTLASTATSTETSNLDVNYPPPGEGRGEEEGTG